MIKQLTIIALVAAIVPLSQAATSGCEWTTVRPELESEQLVTLKHGNYSLQFAGFFNWTSATDRSQQQKFLPLNLREFRVELGKRDVAKRTLTLESECGKLEIDEYLNDGQDRSEALYSIYGFWPAIKVEGVEFCDIDSPPSNYKYGSEQYGGLEMKNELNICFSEVIGKPNERYYRLGSVVVQKMVLNNGAVQAPSKPALEPEVRDDFLRIMQ